MGSYHSSFTYLNKNSSGEGFIVASFEPDNGFTDTYLGMDQIITDSYDGTKKYFYGNKYNSSAEIIITLVKPDGSDFSMADNRRALKWLTGSRKASWLDLYVNDRLVYSFYGSITACQQYKLDARVVGVQVTFTSIHPWAWSAPQFFNCPIGEKMIGIDVTKEGIVACKAYEDGEFGITDDGVIYNSTDNAEFTFDITKKGIVFNDSSVGLEINNMSDDLYTSTSLDIVFKNIDSTSLTIENQSLEEESVITNINKYEVISLDSGQFIISYNYALVTNNISSSIKEGYYMRKWLDDDKYNYIHVDSYDDIFLGELFGDGERTEFALGDDFDALDFCIQIEGQRTSEYKYDAENKTLIFTTAPKEDEAIEILRNVYTLEQNLNKIFGDDFNFVWPQLQPGINKLRIDGTGKGYVEFSYRYPIKIGDCAIDIDSLGINPMCEGDISGAVGSVDGITQLGRKNVILVDTTTGTPYTASIKNSYLYLTESNNSRNRSMVFAESETGALYELTASGSYLYLSDMVKNSSAAVRDSIVLIDEVTNKPYKLTVKDDSLYLSEMQTYGGGQV